MAHQPAFTQGFRELARVATPHGFRVEYGLDTATNEGLMSFESPLGDVKVVRGTDPEQLIREAWNVFATLFTRMQRAVESLHAITRTPIQLVRVSRARSREHRGRRHRVGSRSAGGGSDGDPEPAAALAAHTFGSRP